MAHSSVDILVINREKFVPLAREYEKNWQWDYLVIDESTCIKNHQALLFKWMKHLRKQFKYVRLLSGTPTPNSLLEVWSQIFMLDGGERLDHRITYFRKEYFYPGYNFYRWYPKPHAVSEIGDKIKDVCLVMRPEFNSDLPPRIWLKHELELPPQTLALYKKLKRDFILKLPEGVVKAKNKAVLANKLAQMSNGSIYLTDKRTAMVHTVKLQALEEILNENPNESFLVAYWFKPDKEALAKHFPKAKFLGKEGTEIKDWDAGNTRLLFAHSQSAGHGLNLQYGGNNIVWFTMTWHGEYYKQFNARLHRTGQKMPVKINHLVVKNTEDERIGKGLKMKHLSQKEMLVYLMLDEEENEL